MFGELVKDFVTDVEWKPGESPDPSITYEMIAEDAKQNAPPKNRQQRRADQARDRKPKTHKVPTRWYKRRKR